MKLWDSTFFAVITLAIAGAAIWSGPGAAIGSPGGDGIKHLWTLWWMHQEGAAYIFNGAHTQLLNWPHGLPLWPIEPLHGLFSLPLLGTMGVVPLHNLLLGLNLFATGWLGAKAARVMGMERAAAWTVGTLFMCNPATLHFMLIGAGELMHTWLLPLGFLVWHRTVQRPGWVSGLLLGLFMALATLSSLYLGLFTGLLLVCVGLPTIAREPRKLLPIVLLGLCVFVALIRPALGVHALTFEPTRGLGLQPSLFDALFNRQGNHFPEGSLNRLHLGQLVQTGWIQTHTDGQAFLWGRYLGFGALLLLASSLARPATRAWTWIATTCVGITLALGSRLELAAGSAPGGGPDIPLPFLLLNRLIDHVGEQIHFPARFLLLAWFGLAILAGLHVARHKAWLLLAAIILGESLWVGTPTLPLPTMKLPEAASWGPDDGATQEAWLDMGLQAHPLDGATREASLWAQIHHGHPIQSTPIERIGMGHREGTAFVSKLPMLQDWTLGQVANSGDTALHVASIASLKQQGFTHIFLGHPLGDPTFDASLIRAISRSIGPPEVDRATHKLWALASFAQGGSQAELSNPLIDELRGTIMVSHCPFGEGPDSPCSAKACVPDPNNPECQGIIEAFCAGSTTQQGCTNTGKSAGGCPFAAGSAPCTSTACREDNQGDACRRAVITHCAAQTDDPGCKGLEL